MESVVRNRLGDFERVFRGQFVGGQRRVIRRRELLVAHHVPERVPEQKALKAVGEAVQFVPDEREGALVQRDLGEGVIVVVGEDRRRGRRARQFLDHRRRPIDINRLSIPQSAGPSSERS